MKVNGNHPLAEILAKKLFGLNMVNDKYRERMVYSAIKKAVEYCQSIEQENERLKEKLKIVKRIEQLAQSGIEDPSVDEFIVIRDMARGILKALEEK